MKAKWLMLFLIILFVFPQTSVADEGHSHSDELSEDIEGFLNGKESEHEDHGDMSHTEDETVSHDEYGTTTHEDSSESSQGHGHGGPVVETRPNYTILSVFGLINLAFISIGLWNKKKGGIQVYGKKA
ncbi:hypothetical protein [Robertmurraya kyonggiensis]|uniref:Uncharacterized protein n=1 Tax=Robertmurraya kyonggiensis TaxID=1037680 RepID=A0A4U1D456_9BACI|nr:hypothetical protein [Robertmurraya kyonggiensis]TKC17101.1 hypothetical protein FA727_13685 [Robertmurraya kyonggiensis]